MDIVTTNAEHTDSKPSKRILQAKVKADTITEVNVLAAKRGVWPANVVQDALDAYISNAPENQPQEVNA